MNILDKILAQKKIEVELRRESCPTAELERSLLFNRKTISFSHSILSAEKSGIIAEHKRKSPSKGVINSNVILEKVVKGYEDAGASAVSVLTDMDFFGGDNKDLTEARVLLNIPILRKDFIIDEYQLVEAKSIGADVVLLIAAALEPKRLQELAKFAKFIGLEVLMEVHNREELLNNLFDEIDVIGVNNRNLKDFKESIDTSLQLSELIPDKFVKISESSIDKAETILTLKEAGYKGFLIGEYFMKQSDPGFACKRLAEEVKSMSKDKYTA
ncbi:MAG TPA: indole-3-glycerol phosphate synthase TrpC [Cytophagaceae bacterium]|jgi:indole-3-glycerol phosphate synthase